MINQIFTTALDDEGNGIMGIDREVFALHMSNDFLNKGIAAIPQANADIHSKKFWSLGFPIATLAFSLELALKLHLTESEISSLRKNRKGHHLLSLYESINTDKKDAIINHYETCIARRYSYFNMAITKVGQNSINPKLGTSKEMIEDALKRNDDPFRISDTYTKTRKISCHLIIILSLDSHTPVLQLRQMI